MLVFGWTGCFENDHFRGCGNIIIEVIESSCGTQVTRNFAEPNGWKKVELSETKWVYFLQYTSLCVSVTTLPLA